MLKANRFLAIIALFFFVVSMGSCGGGGGGGGSTTTTGNDSASTVIGPTGGTLTTPSGNATLSVPAGTLSTNTTITISQSTEGDLPGGIIGSYEFKPDGLTFNAPVKISLKYDPTLIPEGINEGNLKLAYESGGDWIIISDSNVDTTNHIVSGQTTHFTKYSITSEKLPYDTFIGDFNSVKINSNGDITNVSNDYYSVDGVTTGMKWQCVEYVNRYYLQVYNKNIRIPGTDAKDYYKTATDRKLSAYLNDGSVSPQPGDILVSEGGTYGHVAIVREVTENRVYVTQQNWFNGNGDVKAPLSKVGNHLDGFGGSKTYTIKGWLRLPASTTDTIPPSVPTGLTATAVSSSQIDLSWNPSTDNVGVAGYKIYDYYGTYLKSVNTTSTSFTGLNPDTQYCFTVSAYDAAGNESGKSNEACATTISGVITIASGLNNPMFVTIDQSNVYWTETSRTNYNFTATVKKASLIGGTTSVIATQIITSSGGIGATGIAVDSNSVYWAVDWGYGGGSIYKIPITGRTITTLASANQPYDIAVDSTFIYWAENNSGTLGSNAIRKVPITGGIVIALTTSGTGHGVMAMDNTYIYFRYSDGFVCKIAKVNKNGGSVIDLASNISYASGITVDNSNVYWTDETSGTISKVSLNGGTVTTLVNGLNNPIRLAVDMNYIYFTEFAGGTTGAGNVKKIPVSGGVATTVASGLNRPWGIVVDNSSVYWSEEGTQEAGFTDGSIKKTPK